MCKSKNMFPCGNKFNNLFLNPVFVCGKLRRSSFGRLEWQRPAAGTYVKQAADSDRRKLVWRRSGTTFRPPGLKRKACPAAQMKIGPGHTGQKTNCSPDNGRFRYRFPVIAKRALTMAGAMTGTPGSPMPVGGA